MNEHEKHAIAQEIVLEHARDIEFLSVCERLDDKGIDDESGDLAREIHDLAMSADVTVQINAAELTKENP